MEGYVASIERTLLQSALDRSNGVQTKAADLLSISYARPAFDEEVRAVGSQHQLDWKGAGSAITERFC